MPRKRKLDATLPADEAGSPPPPGGIGGFWGGSATNLLQSRLREVQQSLQDSILHGITAIELDPDQIDDEVGTDRVGDWKSDEGFQALLADIRRRGQRQPIRVRPARPDWQPAGQAPYGEGARFVLQSGRRRLAAAQELGQPVLAVISTDIGDQKLADLEERFLENTMRADLTGFEQLLSIGLIAQSHKDLAQTEIAERLGVPQGDVSLGLACVDLHDRIVAEVDIRSTPKRAFRELVPKIRGGEGKRGRGKKPAKPSGPEPVTRRAGAFQLEAVPGADGVTLKVRGRSLSEAELQRITDVLAEELAREG